MGNPQPAGEGVDHGTQKDRQAQGQSQEKARLKGGGLYLRGNRGPGFSPGPVLHLVTGILHRGLKGLRGSLAGIIAHPGLAGGQVDLGLGHAGRLGEGPLHPGHARGAMQAAQGEGDFCFFPRHELAFFGCVRGAKFRNLSFIPFLLFLETQNSKLKTDLPLILNIR